MTGTNGPDGATPPHDGATPATNAAGPGGGPDPWQQFADTPGPTSGPHSSSPPTSYLDMSAVTRLLPRQLVIPAAALAVGIIAIIASFATSGVGVNRASDDAVCSAYAAAERSWDSYDTDATEIENLASVARRHSDEDIRDAGKRLDNLTGMFSYGTYSSIVQPIRQLC